MKPAVVTTNPDFNKLAVFLIGITGRESCHDAAPGFSCVAVRIRQRRIGFEDHGEYIDAVCSPIGCGDFPSRPDLLDGCQIIWIEPVEMSFVFQISID